MDLEARSKISLYFFKIVKIFEAKIIPSEWFLLSDKKSDGSNSRHDVAELSYNLQRCWYFIGFLRVQ